MEAKRKYARHVAIVDAEDMPIFERWGWGAGPRGALTNGRGAVLARLILNAPESAFVDHKNRNPSDCRKSNMRPCSRVQNARNQGVRRQAGKTSKYKGVCRSYGRWIVRIYVAGGHLIRLGQFDDEVSAALAYDALAREHHGEFAATNF